jgi:hypothetical protein
LNGFKAIQASDKLFARWQVATECSFTAPQQNSGRNMLAGLLQSLI